MSPDRRPMTERQERMLPLAGLAIGAWAMLPPYVGPTLATESRVEFADHNVPGLVILAVSVAVLLAGRRLAATGTAMFGAGLAIVLAGLWMTATHLPLVRQAVQDEAPAVATVWHTVPGVVVLALGATWVVRTSRQAPATPEAG